MDPDEPFPTDSVLEAPMEMKFSFQKKRHKTLHRPVSRP